MMNRHFPFVPDFDLPLCQVLLQVLHPALLVIPAQLISAFVSVVVVVLYQVLIVVQSVFLAALPQDLLDNHLA
ncbi:hypothetical protein MGWOODY_Mmi1377 [hydrothermal vent metagenome]|uniref:Uncharacterized protein n=1 Tax=hydrothermal vent metagenome TaxID=652676 RepID=A0A170QDD8_9ZZZZ